MLRRPLFWSAAALIAGILLEAPDFTRGPFCALGAASLLGAIALTAAASSPAALRLSGLLVVAGFFCAGRLAALTAETSKPDELRSLVVQHEALFSTGIDLTGRIAASVPEQRPEETTELLLDLEEVTLLGRRSLAHGRALVRLPPLRASDPRPAPTRHLRRGRRIHLFARLESPRAFANPGAFDSASYLRARGIHAVGTVKSWMLLSVEQERRSEGSWTSAARVEVMGGVDDLREALLRRLDGSFPPTPEGARAAAVSAALLLGDRRGLDVEDLRALQEAGLSHLLAVSGFNVAVLSGLLFLLLRCLRVPTRGAAAAVTPVLCLYLLLNSDESSVERAVVMAVSYLAGRMVFRRVHLANTLGLAALVILGLSPLEVLGAGFQLTFLATLALIELAPRIVAWMGDGGAGRGARRTILRALRTAAAGTLAVAAGTLPVTIHHFHRVSPGSIPANLAAGPLMAAAFVGVVALEAAAPVSPRLAAWIAHGVETLVNASFLAARAVGAIPMMTYRRCTQGSLLTGVYYSSLVGLLLPPRRTAPSPLPRALTRVLLAFTLSLLVTPIDTRAAPEGVRLTMLDVGQGEATLIETPGGARILVDAGGASPRGFDLGERVVAPALWHMGITGIDILVVTHPDVDHAGGAASIVRNFAPREVWLPAGSTAWAGRRAIDRLVHEARVHRIPLVQVSRGEATCLAGARVEVLHPAPGVAPEGIGGSMNERSLVLRVDSGERRALLAADAGIETERALQAPSIAADFLKVGHHGSRSASSEGFLRHVAPKVAGISCGRDNRFGHPHRDVLRRLRAAGALVCRTDRHGAFWVELLPGGTRIGASCAVGQR